MKFTTHFDVLRFLKTLEMPSCVQEFNVWSDSIEFHVEPFDFSSFLSIYSFLKQHFQELFEQESDTVVCINYGDPERKLEVRLHEYLNFHNDKKIPSLIPTWKRLHEAAYSQTVYRIDSFSPIIPTTCFYSLKGDLSAKTLLDYLCGLADSKVLVIDADLKSPNLNLFREFYEKDINTSFAELIEIWQCNGLESDYSWSFVNKIAQKPLQRGSLDVYFLPAFNHFSQIICPNSYPEAFVVYPGESWSVVDKIHTLGQKLGVDYILVSLESGMGDNCKWNAPILFDPRVHKTICTNLSETDLEVDLVLSLMKNLNNKIEHYSPLEKFCVHFVSV